MRRSFLIVFFTLPLFAQTVTIGSQSVTAGALLNSAAAPYTLVDLSHPATTNGSIAYVSTGWGGGTCSGAYKVKVLRPASTTSLGNFTLVAERGPFNVTGERNRVQLTPPIDVEKGDLLAITMLQPFATCGVVKSSISSGSVVMRLTGDVTVGNFNGTYLRDNALAARGTDTASVLEGVIPAAGSLQGALGSFFRTSIQLGCPFGGRCNGTLTYHPANAPFSANDVTIPYTLTGNGAVSFPDIVQTMGQSGLGTLDITSDDGFPPLATARIYNDAGANGTSGFTEDMIRPADFLHAGDTAILFTPSDLGLFRMSIGVRTLSAPANVSVQFGNGRISLVKDFPANTFSQVTLSDFGDTDPLPNEQISFTVNSGHVAIYASTTDNKTNDSSARFAKRE
ncbi:MAG TPA: hypothetical protein VII75_13720 [Thermoanaerobaculia bacterium]|nr:hypothetical protein [Thermoanaerobaculia bacterium]